MTTNDIDLRLAARIATTRLCPNTPPCPNCAAGCLALVRAMQDELRAIRSENVRRGMASARAEGRMKGRQPTISRPDVKAKVAQIGPEAAAVALGVSRTTVYRIMAAERRAA